MKTVICHCQQCKYGKSCTSKKRRVQTLQVRAARHDVKEQLMCAVRTGQYEQVEDCLPEKVSVDYYA